MSEYNLMQIHMKKKNLVISSMLQYSLQCINIKAVNCRLRIPYVWGMSPAET